MEIFGSLESKLKQANWSIIFKANLRDIQANRSDISANRRADFHCD